MKQLRWYFSMRFFSFVLAVGAMALGPKGQGRADFVVNGSFETPNLHNKYGRYYSNDPSDLTSWTYSAASPVSPFEVLEAVGDTGPLGPVGTAADGSQFAVLGDGHRTSGGTLVTLSQTLTGLTVGANYTLTFYITPQGWTEPDPNQSITVSLTGSSSAPQTFTSAVGDGKYWDQWTKETENFVATNSSVDLQFSTTSANLIGLDGVSVVDPTPEPATAVLALVGAFGLAGGSWLRRKRSS